MNGNDRNAGVAFRQLVTGYRTKDGERTVGQGLTGMLRGGRLTSLLGPNGAGKSTLLRTLTGMQPPLEGHVEIDGREIGGYTPSELSRQVGVVLTDRPDTENMNVRELVALGRSPYTGFWGRLTAADDRKVEEAIGQVGIRELAERNVRTLSDGERQKVMIAKVLAQDTPLIVLDEPTAFLDYPSKVEIMRLLRGLSARQGLSVLLSTHDLELALQMSDDVWLLDKQRGLETGSPEDLALSGALERYFGREGISYDITSGQFRLINPVAGRAYVSGSGPRRILMRRALERVGYEETKNPDEADVRVATEGNVFTINGEECSTIGTIIDKLIRK